MKILFQNTNETVEVGQTPAHSYSIAPGIRQPIRITDTGAVSVITITYVRNDETAGYVTLPVRPEMNLDLSIFAALAPSLTDLMKLATGTVSVRDKLVVTIIEGVTPKTTNIGVNNINCIRLGGYPGTYGQSNMWTLSNVMQRATSSNSEVEYSKYYDPDLGFADCNFTSATRTGAPPSVIITPQNVGSLPNTIGKVSMGIYFKNLGSNQVTFEAVFAGQVIYSELVESGARGRHYKFEGVDVVGTNNRGYFTVTAKSGTSMSFVWSRMQFNLGTQLLNWSPSNRLKEVGGHNDYQLNYLTDYADGWKVACEDYIEYNSGLTGVPFQDRIYFGSNNNALPVGESNKFLKVNGSAAITIQQGYRLNYANPKSFTTQVFNIINNSGDNVYGTLRYRRVAGLPPVNCRVGVNWLNSYGTYDQMYFTEFRVLPTVTMMGSGGNRIQYYDVTVSKAVDNNNHRAIETLLRSSHVRGVIPNAWGQWADVEIVNSSLTTDISGATPKVITIRMKYKVVGNV